jgi:cytochrome c-type biogenesis protein CcmF
VRARRTLHGEAAGSAFVALFRRNGRRYGGYVVHLGIVIAVVAIATSQARTTEVERTLAPGDAMDVAGYHISFAGLRDITEPQRATTVADLVITGNGASAQLHPGLVQYPNTESAIGSPGIAAGSRDDLYTILAAYDGTGFAWATIRVRVIPLVSWLWAGGAVVGFGALLAALPPPKRRPIAVPVRVADAVGAE